MDSSIGDAIYHCMSRTTGGDFLFTDEVKEAMRCLLWSLSEYCGIQVITYCMMSNHFHLLLRVGKRRLVSDAELLASYRKLHPRLSAEKAAHLSHIETDMREGGPVAQAWRERQLAQMFDISKFMKIFKMRTSIWFNRLHGRKGTLWSERFKSVLVESGRAMETIAAYIDLNSVRAGIVQDPKDYRFCGYSEALAGNLSALRGISEIYGAPQESVIEQYRLVLFGTGSLQRSNRMHFSNAQLEEVRRANGQLSLAVILRHRLRFFGDGVALGSRAFVSKQIQELGRRVTWRKDPMPHDLPSAWGFFNMSILSNDRRRMFV